VLGSGADSLRSVAARRGPTQQILFGAPSCSACCCPNGLVGLMNAVAVDSGRSTSCSPGAREAVWEKPDDAARRARRRQNRCADLKAEGLTAGSAASPRARFQLRDLSREILG